MKHLKIFAAGLCACIGMQLAAQESMFIKSETRYWDQANAYNAYTLFGASGKTYLIDMEGHVVHTWNTGTNPRFLDNGNLLDATKADPSGFQGWQELDWYGNVVWSYTETRSTYAPHHDWVRIYNKKLGAYTTLYIANKTLTHQQAIAAGCDPANNYTGAQMDAIVEVDMSGKIIWEWWFFDHVVQDLDASKSTYGVVADHPGKIDLNMPGRPVRKDWLHCNSMDFNEELGQIVTNSVQGEFYVIDHDNTFIPNDPDSSIALAAGEKGDFLYRFGDPARYDQGDPPSILEDWTKSTTGDKQIGGSHDIHWIKAGLPGAGHFLVFNNGEYLYEMTPQSYIFEINPFMNSAGATTSNYVNPPDAGYYKLESPNKDAMKQTKNISKQVTWIYYTKTCQSLYSTIGSGAQRLPNGNTLICAMNQGHVIEVTSDGKVVWEYIVPVTRDGIKKIITDNYPTYNAIFRAYRYTSDHPALSGRDLTAGNTITGFDPEYYVPADLTGTSSVDGPEAVSSNLGLKQNYPNPFSDRTLIPFNLDKPGYVKLSIFRMDGSQVRTLINAYRRQGNHVQEWDGYDGGGNRMSPGTYYYTLVVDGKQQSKQMVFVR
jgi:hypothetical protein